MSHARFNRVMLSHSLKLILLMFLCFCKGLRPIVFLAHHVRFQLMSL